ncbi:MAG: hypothetical protein FWE77_02290 [Clostridia bacterium]|nr:hypothetical protein [Clostridia bacterium]
MQAYEGYIEDGRFYPIGQPFEIPGRRRVILTVLDELTPESKEATKKWRGGLSSLDNPFEVPDFRAFSREELHER